MSDFARHEVLYLAGLFHDIAKGRGGDHSTLGAADALRFARAHGLARDDCELVAWLVANHLVMSSTAQKQDVSDPDVVRAFAQRVKDERHLAALYLITVADIRGTSPKVWNAWKAKLLEDLFHLTRRLLGGDGATAESSVQARQDAAQAKLRLYAVPEHAHDKFWRELDTAYFIRHDAQDIAWHTRLLYARPHTQAPVVKARLSPAGEGLQVMVYVPDQKELFARICSFFENISYDIHEAKVYTTRHGYALDTFQVQDPDNRQPQYRDLMSYIEYELAERLLHKTPLPPLTKPRLNRQLRHFPISPEVNIQPDDKGTYQVLFVVAGDRPGLLSRIARTLTRYDINLHTAKINTLGARAEDVFLVTGAALHDPKTVVKFESDLVESCAHEAQLQWRTIMTAYFCELGSAGLIAFRGPDAVSFLHAQLTSDVASLLPPRTQYSGYCSPKGRLLTTLLVWRNEEEILIQLPATLRKEHSESSLEVCPAGACDGLGRLRTLRALRHRGHRRPRSSARVGRRDSRYTPHAVVSRSGISVTRLPVERYLVCASVEALAQVRNVLSARGAAQPESRWSALDIEAGIPVITPPTQEEYVPQMVNLDLIGGVSFTKGCYPGQEIVARMHYLGRLKQRMYRVHLPGLASPSPGDPLYSADFGPEQASGAILNAVPAGTGGHDALAVIQMSSASSKTVHWRSLNGPALQFLQLPYSLGS